jgi:hypothetical protein
MRKTDGMSDEHGKPEQAVARDRRKLVKGAGFLVLSVLSRPLLGGGPMHAPTDQALGDDLVLQSGPGLFAHVHELRIPARALKSPPLDGIELVTSEALLHRHTLALTHEELRLVSGGGVVTKQASSHVFAIARASLMQ